MVDFVAVVDELRDIFDKRFIQEKLLHTSINYYAVTDGEYGTLPN